MSTTIDGKLTLTGSGGAGTSGYTWTIMSPTVRGLPGPRLYQNQTAVRIDAYVTAATSVTFNIEERTTIGSAGTNLLTADLVADIDGVTTTTINNPNLDSGNWLWLDISAVDGTPDVLVVTLTTTSP